jgi:hypothetical protein
MTACHDFSRGSGHYNPTQWCSTGTDEERVLAHAALYRLWARWRNLYLRERLIDWVRHRVRKSMLSEQVVVERNVTVMNLKVHCADGACDLSHSLARRPIWRSRACGGTNTFISSITLKSTHLKRNMYMNTQTWRWLPIYIHCFLYQTRPEIVLCQHIYSIRKVCEVVIRVFSC